MEKATDSEVNAHYNDEVNFVEGIIAFHPEVYEALNPEEQELVKVYFLTGDSEVENIFAYRNELIRAQPGIDIKAHTVFQKILDHVGIKDFKYSTKPQESWPGSIRE